MSKLMMLIVMNVFKCYLKVDVRVNNTCMKQSNYSSNGYKTLTMTCILLYVSELRRFSPDIVYYRRIIWCHTHKVQPYR